MSYEIFKYLVAKKRNKRIDLLCYKSEEGNDLAFVIRTKRLIGDWRDRNILESGVQYGYESMVVVYELIDMLLDDKEVDKIVNPLKGEMSKNRFEVNHNLNRKRK